MFLIRFASFFRLFRRGVIFGPKVDDIGPMPGYNDVIQYYDGTASVRRHRRVNRIDFA